MDAYTVLVLRPDYMQDGSARDYIYRSHVLAKSKGRAIKAAQFRALISDGLWYADNHTNTREAAEDYAPVSVYEGHLLDHIDRAIEEMSA